MLTLTYTAGTIPSTSTTVLTLGTDFVPATATYSRVIINDTSQTALSTSAPIIQAQANATSFLNNTAPWYTGTFDTGTHVLQMRHETTFTGGMIITGFIDDNPLVKLYDTSPPASIGTAQIALAEGWIANSIVANQPTTRASTAVACQGDSLTWGGQLTSGFGLTTGQSYPAVLQSLLGSTAFVEVSNLGYPGATTSQLAPATAAQMLNDPLLFLGAIGIYLAGINDLFAGTSNATILANIATWVAAIRAVGATAIVGTICHIGPAASASYATINANADAINATIRATYTAAPTLTLDFAANADLQAYANTTYRNADQLNYTPAGYALMAQLAYAQI